MKLIPTRESRAVCVWDTDEYVSHIDSFFKISYTHFLFHMDSNPPTQSFCRGIHFQVNMREYVNRNTSCMNCMKYAIRKKSSFPFLRLGENLPSDAMRYMVCLIDNVDKC